MSVVVVGSVAYDDIETPKGRAKGLLGGSATHFCVAGSFFSPVELVAAVGEDFAPQDREFLAGRGIGLEGLQVLPGKTFRWGGRYHENMNVRDSLYTDLNVFADFRPVLSTQARRAEIVFLANIVPDLQIEVLDQLEPGRRLVACDTMTHWIEGQREAVERMVGRTDMLIINEEEAKLLAAEQGVVRAARRIQAMGPSRVLIKRGEYGIIYFSPDSVFAVPAYPLEEATDPTGAGDAFAGACMGYLAQTGDLSDAGMRRAMVYGTVVASFIVEDFGLNRLRRLTRQDVEGRYREFVALTSFGQE